MGGDEQGLKIYSPEQLANMYEASSIKMIVCVKEETALYVIPELIHKGFTNLIYYNYLYCEGDSYEIMKQNVGRDDHRQMYQNHFREFFRWGLYDERNIFFSKYAEGTRMLDLGCGCGAILLRMLIQKCDAYGLDCCDWKKEYFKQKIRDFEMPTEWSGKYVFGYGEKLPFEDDCFDLVLSNSSLEHVDDVKMCVLEMLRVVKHGGFVRICAPSYNNTFECHYEIDFKKTLKGNENEFKQYLIDNGESLDLFNELNFIDTEDILEALAAYGLDKIEEIIDYNKKMPNVDGTDRIDILIKKK